MAIDTLNVNDTVQIQSGNLTRRGLLRGVAGGASVGLAPALFHRTAWASTSLKELGFEVFGRGPNRVIVLHDWSVATDGSYHIAKRFIDRSAFTLAFVDVRGYGLSKGLEGDYTHEEIVSDVAAVADVLGWKTFSVIGHSMTGMTVQRMMVDMPERLQRVVASTPVPASGVTLDETSFALFASMASDDEAFMTGMGWLTSDRYTRDWLNYKLAQNRLSVSAEAMKAYTAMWANNDFSADVAGAAAPILVLYGAHDTPGLRKDATSHAFTDWYPNLTEYVCAAGHYPMVEAPVEFASVVQRFLHGDAV